MSQSKKYDFQVIQEGETWTAGILRRVTSRSTVASKVQEGFATQEEATQWAEAELKVFMDNQVARNKRRSANRK